MEMHELFGIICLAIVSFLGMCSAAYGHVREDETWTWLGWSLIALAFVAAVTLVFYPTNIPLDTRF